MNDYKRLAILLVAGLIGGFVGAAAAVTVVAIFSPPADVAAVVGVFGGGMGLLVGLDIGGLNG